MKFLITFLVLFFLASCTNGFDQSNLLGSWKQKDFVDTTGQNVTNKISFFENDSMVGEIFTNGKLLHKFSAKYEVDEASRTLTTFPGQGKSFHFEILKLNGNELELQKIGTKRDDKYVRF